MSTQQAVSLLLKSTLAAATTTDAAVVAAIELARRIAVGDAREEREYPLVHFTNGRFDRTFDRTFGRMSDRMAGQS